MATIRRDERPTPIRLTFGSAALVVGGLLAVLLLRNVFVAAHRVLGWSLAATVAALLISPLVTRLARHIPRIVALLLTGVLIAAMAGGLVYGVFDDLAAEAEVLGERAPSAAARLAARADGIGQVAVDLRLEERTRDLAAAIDDRFGARSDALTSTAGTVPTYFVCFILTVFLVLFGPRIVDGGLRQIPDEQRRDRLRQVLHEGAGRGVRYLWAALAQALVAGGLVYLAAAVLDLPAPVALALVAGVVATVPYIGFFVGALPVVLLVAGFESVTAAGVLLGAVVAVQVFEALWLRRRVDDRTLHVGPAVPVVVAAVGFEVYGIGAALYGAAVAVLLLGLADAAATDDGELPTPDQDWDEPATSSVVSSSALSVGTPPPEAG